MTTYQYVKLQPKLPRTKKSKFKKNYRFLPFLLLVVGLVLLANAGWPILAYQLRSWENFNRQLLSPIGRANTQILGEGLRVDYSHPEVWFPTAPELPQSPNKITHYTISIPRLEIENAVVEIGAKDLLKSLIHYGGTALPGRYGNAVVFGHSTLVQFFNPESYKTIFSTLPTLDEGDEILVNFDGIAYRYQVVRLFEVKPTDFSVLSQNYEGRYLSLITCVPPGTYLKRLVVWAKLV